MHPRIMCSSWQLGPGIAEALSGASMKIHNCVPLFLLATISITASGQCAKPEMKPLWNPDKGQFQCVDPSKGKSSSENDFIQPTGDKSSCASSRDSLLAACPKANEGKECRGKAKSTFNVCYKRPKGQSENEGAQSSSETDRKSVV